VSDGESDYTHCDVKLLQATNRCYRERPSTASKLMLRDSIGLGQVCKELFWHAVQMLQRASVRACVRACVSKGLWERACRHIA
jgi:hypothetical protein